MIGWLRRGYLGLLWLGLLGVALLLAPASDGQDGARVFAFFAFEGEAIAVAVFNSLGLWPLIYAAVLLRDPPQRVPMWPFVGLSFVVGNFALLPGLVLRRWRAPARAPLGLLRRLLTGPALAAALVVASLALLAYAVSSGSPQAFLALAERSSLVYVMSFDFLSLVLAWPVLLHDDARRHPGPTWRLVLGWIPLIGPSLWLLVRGSPTE